MAWPSATADRPLATRARSRRGGAGRPRTRLHRRPIGCSRPRRPCWRARRRRRRHALARSRAPRAGALGSDVLRHRHAHRHAHRPCRDRGPRPRAPVQAFDVQRGEARVAHVQRLVSRGERPVLQLRLADAGRCESPASTRCGPARGRLPAARGTCRSAIACSGATAPSSDRQHRPDGTSEVGEPLGRRPGHLLRRRRILARNYRPRPDANKPRGDPVGIAAGMFHTSPSRHSADLSGVAVARAPDQPEQPRQSSGSVGLSGPRSRRPCRCSPSSPTPRAA